MGFARKTFRLVFEDPELEGLEVRVRPMSLAQLLDAAKLDTAGASNSSATDAYLPYLADALIDWNLEETDGTPIPATIEGLRSLDMAFLLDMIGAWTRATAGVPRPLEPSSTGGGPSAEASIPMEPLSASPSSS